MVIATVGGLLATTWSAILGSHPAYLVTLVVVGLAAAAVVVWALLSTDATRSPLRTWISRSALVLGTLGLVGVLVYLRPLRADDVAIDALADDSAVAVSTSSTQIRLDPVGERRSIGLVFYPGAKVDPRAYARILRPVAEAGYPVVILKLPFNLAIVDPDAAASVVDEDDAIDRWLVGGHSLGGTMGARFAAGEADGEVAGLLLWASYPASSIASADRLDVLSVSAGNDGLATPADIDDSQADLPSDAEFLVVDGAIHAFFGDYGSQRGDGEPTVTRADAQAQIVAATLAQLQRIEREV